jgi:SAM-dependent methyltransferase
MGEIKERAIVLLGAGLLFLVGRNGFYRLAQERTGIAGRIASAFCQGHAGRVGQNYGIYISERDKERITDIALKYYSDDNLHGFGEVDYGRFSDGKSLLEQRRALVFPLIERAIASDNPSTVLEIGTGNGDALAYLASKHTHIQFIGVDLSVANAARSHARSNLRFVKGYALDQLRSGEISGDLVFAASTFCIFAPRELKGYLDALKGTKRVIVTDPVTFGHRHTTDRVPKSLHMDLYMWWHNYFGYLSAAGYDIEHFDTVPWSYSWSPNCKVVRLSAVMSISG